MEHAFASMQLQLDADPALPILPVMLGGLPVPPALQRMSILNYNFGDADGDEDMTDADNVNNANNALGQQ